MTEEQRALWTISAAIMSEFNNLRGREEFLSRGSNKQQLISLISDELRWTGSMVTQVEGDADIDITKTAETQHIHIPPRWLEGTLTC